MYLVVIAWLYVAILMAVVEATGGQSSWLGALITLLLYGVLPVAILIYIMGTPLRRKRRQALEDHPPNPPSNPDAK